MRKDSPFSNGILKTASKPEIQELVVKHADNDDDLESLFRAIKKERGELWTEIRNEFLEAAYFFEDSKNQFIRRLARQHIRKLESTDLYSELMDRHSGDLSGVELKQDKSERYAFFCADAQIVGNVRYTSFDSKGFISHTSRATYSEVLKEAIQEGFNIETNGMLEKCFSTEGFSSN